MKTSLYRLKKALAASMMLVAAHVADAATFQVSYNSASVSLGGDPVSLLMTLTTAGNAITFEEVLSVTGTVSVAGVSHSIDGLIPAASFQDNDNTFKYLPDYVTFNGLGFYYNSGINGDMVAWNLYTDGGSQVLYSSDVASDWTPVSSVSDSLGVVSVTVVASAVPEPSGLALLAAGLSAVGFAARRRKAGALS